ncbi:hypothetical protein thalar_02880 [Litoreibacter arenae DSM 19593]|uniref:3-dehydroquinate dehydratase n=1 Tax=Litoreibacter arenae DSM 19593 TaxID=1123360 RepID=S9RTA2_9RHOB|nr:hypothetical protein thalar_02880 [Litoreibacter arenae DSM 19593]
MAGVMADGRGMTDRLLAGVVARLIEDGVRVAGALRETGPSGESGQCDTALRLLPEGPVVPITQNLGAGSAACRMDAGALETAVALATADLAANGADLVVLNKFGISEAEGRGFRALIGEAVANGVPVLVGLSETHRAAFGRFADSMAIDLPPSEEGVIAWCRAVITPAPDAASVVADRMGKSGGLSGQRS